MNALEDKGNRVWVSLRCRGAEWCTGKVRYILSQQPTTAPVLRTSPYQNHNTIYIFLTAYDGLRRAWIHDDVRLLITGGMEGQELGKQARKREDGGERNLQAMTFYCIYLVEDLLALLNFTEGS